MLIAETWDHFEIAKTKGVIIRDVLIPFFSFPISILIPKLLVGQDRTLLRNQHREITIPFKM